jgi:hypothetical protein
MKQCFLILSFLFYTAFCIANEDMSAKSNTSSHDNPADDLRFIMLKLQSAFNASKHSDIQQDKILNDNIPELISAVENLLVESTHMKTSIPNLNLNAQELKTFQSMANQLYIDVLNLQQVTYRYDYHRIEMTYQQLNQTCVGCHKLFRPQ